jgi:hypothetical protein
MAYASQSQSISGSIVDEYNKAVPFANILIQESGSGASADDHGRYHITIDPGVYNLIISSVGYQSTRVQIIIGDAPIIRDFQLTSSPVELEQIEIKVRRRDPAYDIMKKAIDLKDLYLSQVKTSRSKAYLRASEVMEVTEKRDDDEEDPEPLKAGDFPPDPLAEARKKEEARLSKINLVEMQLVLNFKYPNQFKEERTAFKSYGSRAGLFIPVFHETDFNFYHNLVDLKRISEIPMISPLSRTAILSYRFKLEQILKEGKQTVYKIRVTPRKSGDATAKGFVFINDSTWNINRLELTLHKGSLKFYDEFTISQSYQEVDEGLWIPHRQEFSYQTRFGRKLFKGTTLLAYSDFENDYAFSPQFFGNEVAVTTSEAYKRDSSYWNSARPEPLAGDQKKVIEYRDSLEAVRTSKKYLDSLETAYNKITFGEVLYHGIGLRSEEKKSNIYLPPLIGLIDFSIVGGWRIGPNARYFRRFKNERIIWTGGALRIGLKNKDLQGNLNFGSRYDPFRQGDVSFKLGRQFSSINIFDAYLNQLRISNYIMRDFWDFFHKIELFNGFYVSTDIGFSNRKSIEGYDATSIINEVIDEVEPVKFERYQALITNLRLSYVPKQKFMREPFQKVVLGSKFPKFLFNHTKGWQDLLDSDVDFDYIDLGVDHSLLLGTLGNSRYTFTAGKFINARDLRYVDLKRFRQSDPYLYSDPMHSFQLLDTSLVATDLFLEGHYIHHFNGAMINNLPLIKRLKIRTVAGAGFMWIKESNFRHEEIFGGVERILS